MAVGTRYKLDQVCASAVELARAAVLEEPAGDHIEAVAEGDRLVTHLFECGLPGYRGWRWAVTVTRIPRSRQVTICETVLLPGPDALVAPEWVPWHERLQPGDLGVGDLMPTSPDDDRLVPGYTLSDDPAVEDVNWELGLGRSRVMSLEGRQETAQRWYEGDNGPDAPISVAAPRAARCGTCGFYLPLAGSMRTAFGACGNLYAPDDGRVVSADHGCGAHSEVLGAPASEVEELPTVYDDGEVDEVPTTELSAGPTSAPVAEKPDRMAHAEPGAEDLTAIGASVSARDVSARQEAARDEMAPIAEGEAHAVAGSVTGSGDEAPTAGHGAVADSPDQGSNAGANALEFEASNPSRASMGSASLRDAQPLEGRGAEGGVGGETTAEPQAVRGAAPVELGAAYGVAPVELGAANGVAPVELGAANGVAPVEPEVVQGVAPATTGLRPVDESGASEAVGDVRPEGSAVAGVRAADPVVVDQAEAAEWETAEAEFPPAATASQVANASDANEDNEVAGPVADDVVRGSAQGGEAMEDSARTDGGAASDIIDVTLNGSGVSGAGSVDDEESAAGDMIVASGGAAGAGEVVDGGEVVAGGQAVGSGETVVGGDAAGSGVVAGSDEVVGGGIEDGGQIVSRREVADSGEVPGGAEAMASEQAVGGEIAGGGGGAEDGGLTAGGDEAMSDDGTAAGGEAADGAEAMVSAGADRGATGSFGADGGAAGSAEADGGRGSEPEAGF